MRKGRLQASCEPLVTPFVHMRMMLTETDWLLHRVLASLLQVWLNVRGRVKVVELTRLGLKCVFF